jgi:DNA (cytosine-5)-methyltransferase 1
MVSGDPCPPVSVAGKRKGTEDDRYLWPEVRRLTAEIRPRWLVRENVAGNITLGLDEILDDLEYLNYSTQSLCIPAAAVGAHHERYRIFVVAHSGIQSDVQTNTTISTVRNKWDARNHVSGGSWAREPGISRGLPKSEVGRVANGFSEWMGGLKALGNAVVPQQIYPIFKAIMDIERVTG